MIENKSFTKIKRGNEKNFGIVFSIFFLILSLYPLIVGNTIKIWLLIISITLFLISIFFSKILIIPNKIWFQFGILLGTFVSPVIMGLIFFSTVTPIGFFMRMIKKDFFKLKINKKLKSYWIERKDPINSMKNQF